MSRLCLYFIEEKPTNRWFNGDQYIRKYIRRLIRGKQRISSLKKVFLSLCMGFDQLQIQYYINLPFNELCLDDKIIVLGLGRNCLLDYKNSNKIIAGIGLIGHPFEWPDLLEEYPVAKYLQHSCWTNNIYVKYYHGTCDIWFVGIDTDKWKPSSCIKKYDFLIYNKIMWNYPETDNNLRTPILNKLKNDGFTYREIVYNDYTEKEYHSMLNQCRSMIFLCEHESQGIAYQEALSMDVPVFAWDQGFWLDPNRFKWGEKEVSATSVPYFSPECGFTFKNLDEFQSLLPSFIKKVETGHFHPRNYIEEHLTLKKSALRMLQIINSVYSS